MPEGRVSTKEFGASVDLVVNLGIRVNE
jgi:hypothetical protein